MIVNRFDSARRFQIWRMVVSHSQLLLRSNRTSEEELRIEVLFRGVTAMKLLNSMDGLSIREATDEEQLVIYSDVPRPAYRSSCFIIESDGFEGYVVALALLVDETNLSYSARSTILIE